MQWLMHSKMLAFMLQIWFFRIITCWTYTWLTSDISICSGILVTEWNIMQINKPVVFLWTLLMLVSGLNLHWHVFAKVRNTITFCSSKYRFWYRRTSVKPKSTTNTHQWRVLSKFSCSVSLWLCQSIIDGVCAFDCYMLLALFRSILWQSRPNKASLKCPSIWWNLAHTFWSMSDAWRYAVWPNPRSMSRALHSWKTGHFQKLSALPSAMGAGSWPRILKLGQIWSGRIFDIRLCFSVTWLWS